MSAFAINFIGGSDVILFLITSPPLYNPQKETKHRKCHFAGTILQTIVPPPTPPCISMQRRTNALLAIGGHPPMRSPVTTMSGSGGQGVTQKWPCGGRPRSSLCVGKSKQSGSTGARNSRGLLYRTLSPLRFLLAGSTLARRPSKGRARWKVVPGSIPLEGLLWVPAEIALSVDPGRSHTVGGGGGGGGGGGLLTNNE